MNVEVVLTQDDKSLGHRGDVVKVSSGYATNFLIPQKKAVLATASTLKEVEAQKARRAKHESESLEQAKILAAKLEKTFVRVEVLAGADGKLFGAVTAQDIQESLHRQGIALDRKTLHLEEPIRTLGGHQVPVKLHPEVKAVLKLQVAKKA